MSSYPCIYNRGDISNKPVRFSEGKIDLIDKRLDSVDRLINTFLSSETAQSPQSAQQDAPPPTPAPTPTSTLATQTSRTPHITDDEDTTSSVPELSQVSRRKSLRGSQHALRGSGAGTGNNHEEDSEEKLVEGPSALSAHSNFAIDLVDRLAAFDTRELLDRLRRITDAIKAQRQVPDLLLPHPAPPVAATDFVKNRMPPIETAVAVLRAAQGKPLKHPKYVLHLYFSQTSRPRPKHVIILNPMYRKNGRLINFHSQASRATEPVRSVSQNLFF